MAVIRDLRSDLIARLEDIPKRRDRSNDRHLAELQAIQDEEKVLRAMLELEEKRVKNGHDRHVQEKKPLRPGAANAIESEILTLLSDRHRWEHSTIKENLIEAGHGNSSDSHFGQSVQGTLLSLRTRGLVDLPERGVWEITEKGISGP
jgi:hypothetical protein